MSSQSRYNSPMLILRPHPWTYHPVEVQRSEAPAERRTSPEADPPDAAGPRRGQPPSGLVRRLVRWLEQEWPAGP